MRLSSAKQSGCAQVSLQWCRPGCWSEHRQPCCANELWTLEQVSQRTLCAVLLRSAAHGMPLMAQKMSTSWMVCWTNKFPKKVLLKMKVIEAARLISINVFSDLCSLVLYTSKSFNFFFQFAFRKFHLVLYAGSYYTRVFTVLTVLNS